MITEQKKTIKPWGYEIVWAQTEFTKGTILGINRGQSLARSKRINLEENLLVTSGTLTIKTDSDKTDLGRGQSYFICSPEDYTLSAQFGDVELIFLKTTT